MNRIPSTTDGFSARYYVREQFEDLFRAFFAGVSSEICGQDAGFALLKRHEAQQPAQQERNRRSEKLQQQRAQAQQAGGFRAGGRLPDMLERRVAQDRENDAIKLVAAHLNWQL